MVMLDAPGGVCVRGGRGGACVVRPYHQQRRRQARRGRGGTTQYYSTLLLGGWLGVEEGRGLSAEYKSNLSYWRE